MRWYRVQTWCTRVARGRNPAPIRNRLDPPREPGELDMQAWGASVADAIRVGEPDKSAPSAPRSVV